MKTQISKLTHISPKFNLNSTYLFLHERKFNCPFPSLHCCCMMNTTTTMQLESS